MKTSTRAKPASISEKLALIASEFKIICLRECALEDNLATCDCPKKFAAYWRDNIETNQNFNGEVESLYVILLNVRLRPKGHHLIAQGTQDTLLCHPREVFRAAIIGGAAKIVLLHNHPSGDPTPSEADIKVTRAMIQAGKLVQVELCDHIIMGRVGYEGVPPGGFVSLKSLGYFF